MDQSDFPGAKTIDRLEFPNLHFLTDQIAGSLSSADFNLETGKPLSNLYHNSTVDSFFLNTVSNCLKERINVNDTFVFQFPQVLDTDLGRDLIVAGETSISAVFVAEGASMKNMLGYYFYYVDASGVAHLLDNDDSTSGYYYRPTIIFPHVYSDSYVSGSLQTGDTRVLKGNLPNGQFSNIRVGFFLVPHGWYAFEQSSPIHWSRILYSTLQLGQQYGDNAEYQMLNDKIYAVYARAANESNDELLLVGFEDIVYYEVDDLDYNDCVVGLVLSPVKNVTNYPEIPIIVVPEEPPIYNNIIMCSDDGEYLELRADLFTIQPGVDYVFNRILRFTARAARDATFVYLNALARNFKKGISTSEESSEYLIQLTYLFRKNDMIKARQANGDYHLFLMETKHNKHLATALLHYQQQVIQNQQSSSYRETYELYANTEKELQYLIRQTDVIDKPHCAGNGTFRIIGNGVMDAVRGKTHLPFKIATNYMIYKSVAGDEGLVVNVRMDRHPDGYMADQKNFVRWVSFVVDGAEHLAIDLADLSLHQVVDGSLVATPAPSVSLIRYSSVQTDSAGIKSLVSVFRTDSGATYRTVTIKDTLVFYCIRFARVKNNPTMVFLESDFIVTWSNAANSISGTYFNKRNFYPVDNLAVY